MAQRPVTSSRRQPLLQPDWRQHSCQGGGSSSAVDDQGQLRTGCWVRATSGSTQRQKPPSRSRCSSRMASRSPTVLLLYDQRAMCRQRWARQRRPLSDNLGHALVARQRACSLHERSRAAPRGRIWRSPRYTRRPLRSTLLLCRRHGSGRGAVHFGCPRGRSEALIVGAMKLDATGRSWMGSVRELVPGSDLASCVWRSSKEAPSPE